MNRSSLRRVPLATAAWLALGLGVTACATSSEDVDQTSVDPGAGKDEYAKALKDMDPVELKLQVLTPKDSPNAQATDAYAEAVEKMSDGKITFKLHYSGSIAGTDTESAVADGLIDVAPLHPSMHQDKFPIQAYASNFAFMNDNTPVVGSLQSISAWLEAGYDELIVDEMRDNGLEPLLPMTIPSSNMMLCGDEPVRSLAEAKKTSVRVATTGNAAEVKAIGASTVDLPTLEIFEGMQRGTVDCVTTSWAVPVTFNLGEVSKSWMVDPTVQFTGSSEALAVGKDTWDSMPLAARQLMWDELDVYLKSYIDNNMIDTLNAAMTHAEEEDVTLYEYGSDLKKSLTDLQDREIADAGKNSPDGFDGKAFAESTEQTHEEWKRVLVDLGYDDSVTWEEFRQDKAEDVDVQPVVDEISEKVLDEHRPTAD